MAIDVSSPRISFSHDLNGFDFVPVESHAAGSDSYFDFVVPQSLQISSADELFADGKILPIHPRPPDPVPEPSNPRPTNKKRLIEFLSAGADEEEDPERRDRDPKTPFWQFRRSISDNSRTSGLLRPWLFLTRSNSTGSAGIQKQHSLKQASINPRPNPAMPFNHGTSFSKKNSSCGAKSYGNGGVRISPVLNIPSSYIAKGTVSLFGFGSLFCSKKSKNKTK